MAKYQKKRKADLSELEVSATNYGVNISLQELKRMCDDTLFKFENHIKLCEEENRPIKTLQGILRKMTHNVNLLNSISG
jgi:hypothetical protein